MKEQQVFYKGKTIPQSYFEKYVNEILYMFAKNKITSNNLVICKANTHIGIYIQWLACEKAQVIPIFVSSEYSIDHIKLLNNNIGASIILESIGVNNYIHIISDSNKKPTFLNNIDDMGVIHMTSATTGNPKMVLRTKKQLDAEIDRYSKYLGITEHDIILPIVPLYHSFGFISGMLLSIKLNAKLVIPDMVMPRNIIKLSNDSKATVILGVSYFYKKMIEVNHKYSLNKELRYIISSGGPMEEGVQKKFKERFGLDLLQQYGSTETGSLCIGLSDNYKCVGKPIPDVKVKIINDEYNKPCLYVSTPETIGCYVTKDSVVKLQGELYKMGDLARITDDGKVELLGRWDDILIVDGKKINKNFVASIIQQIEHVDEVNLFLNKYNDVIELTCQYSGDKEVEKSIFIEYCRKFLAEYQIPKRYLRVSAIEKRIKKSWKTE